MLTRDRGCYGGKAPHDLLTLAHWPCVQGDCPKFPKEAAEGRLPEFTLGEKAPLKYSIIKSLHNAVRQIRISPGKTTDFKLQLFYDINWASTGSNRKLDGRPNSLRFDRRPSAGGILLPSSRLHPSSCTSRICRTAPCTLVKGYQEGGATEDGPRTDYCHGCTSMP